MNDQTKIPDDCPNDLDVLCELTAFSFPIADYALKVLENVSDSERQSALEATRRNGDASHWQKAQETEDLNHLQELVLAVFDANLKHRIEAKIEFLYHSQLEQQSLAKLEARIQPGTGLDLSSAKEAVRQQYEFDAWQAACEVDKVSSYESFLRRCPTSEFVPAAKDRLETFRNTDSDLWNRTDKDDYQAIADYIRNAVDATGEAHYSLEASQRLEQLRKLDEAMFSEATTIESCERYLNDEPRKMHVAEVEDRLAALRLEKADAHFQIAVNSERWQNHVRFLIDNPEHSNASEIRAKLAQRMDIKIEQGKDFEFRFDGIAPFEMIWVDPGSFTFQNNPLQPDRAKPTTINHGFWISKSHIGTNTISDLLYCQPARNATNEIMSLKGTDLLLVQNFLRGVSVSCPEDFHFGFPTELEWEFTTRSECGDFLYPWGNFPSMDWKKIQSGLKCLLSGPKAPFSTEEANENLEYVRQFIASQKSFQRLESEVQALRDWRAKHSNLYRTVEIELDVKKHEKLRYIKGDRVKMNSEVWYEHWVSGWTDRWETFYRGCWDWDGIIAAMDLNKETKTCTIKVDVCNQLKTVQDDDLESLRKEIAYLGETRDFTEFVRAFSRPRGVDHMLGGLLTPCHLNGKKWILKGGCHSSIDGSHAGMCTPWWRYEWDGSEISIKEGSDRVIKGTSGRPAPIGLRLVMRQTVDANGTSEHQQ